MGGLAEAGYHVGRGSPEVICPKCGRMGAMRFYCSGSHGAVLVVHHPLSECRLATRMWGSPHKDTGYRIICPRCGREGDLVITSIMDRGTPVIRAWVRHPGEWHAIVQRVYCNGHKDL
jgi:hypothetical protein